MKAISYYQIHADDIIKEERLERFLPKLEDYKSGGRQDVFDNIDLLSENVRSKTRTMKNFSLFNKTFEIDNSTVIVCGLYLEILEYWGLSEVLTSVVEKIVKRYPNNRILFQWNHDEDFKKYSSWFSKFDNAFMLNFNTSCSTSRDIVLPFWTVENEGYQLQSTRSYYANLVCSMNHQIRYNLVNTLNNKQNYVVCHKLPQATFYELISKSIFTFCPRGSGLSSYRFFESLHARSIPVLFTDEVILPYLDDLKYSDMIVRIPEKMSTDFEFIDKTLKSVDYVKMISNIDKNIHKFTLLGVQEEIYRRLQSQA